MPLATCLPSYKVGAGRADAGLLTGDWAINAVVCAFPPGLVLLAQQPQLQQIIAALWPVFG